MSFIVFLRLFTAGHVQLLIHFEQRIVKMLHELSPGESHKFCMGVDAAERIMELVDGSVMHVMKDCAHWPQWERPEEHDTAVCQFLDSINV